MRYRTYTLRIEQSDDVEPHAMLADDVSGALAHAEDVVNDVLPYGFYCKIDGPTGEGIDLAAVERLERMADDAA